MRKLLIAVGGIFLVVGALEGVARLAERWTTTDHGVRSSGSGSGGTLLPVVEFNLPGLAVVDATLGYRLRPNASLPGDIHVNAQGFRGPVVDIPKPAGTYRILALGDSTTFGIGSGEDGTYPRLLQKELERRCVPALAEQIDVINGGVPGYTSTQILRRLQTEWLAYHPDLVLVMQGLNDLTAAFLYEQEARPGIQGATHRVAVIKARRMLMQWWAGSLTHSAFAPWLHRLVARRMLLAMLKSKATSRAERERVMRDAASEAPTVVLRRLEENLDHMAQLAATARFDLAIVGYPGISYQRAKQFRMAESAELLSPKGPFAEWEMSILRRPDAFEKFFTVGVRVGRTHESVAELQKQWARRRGVPYVDLRAVFHQHGSVETLYSESGIHFNPAGNAVIADAIATELFAQRCAAPGDRGLGAPEEGLR